MQKQPSKGFFKESVMRNFAEFTRKHLCRNQFFDKVKLCRSSTSLKKESLPQVLSCEICEICESTFFENTTVGLLLIIALSIVVKGELVNENLNYNTKTKAYVPILARSVNYQNRAVLVQFEKQKLQKQLFADVLQKGVLKISANSTGKHLCWRHFLIKLQS